MDQSRTRGVSPVIAVILLVAVTVTLSAVIGGFALDLGQQTTSESSQQEVGVSTSYTDGQYTATVVTGSADEVKLLVNGTEQATISNASAGDSVSVNASAGDDVTVVTVSDGSSSVATSETVSDSSSSSSDSTTTSGWTLIWEDSFEDDASGSEPDAWNITSDGSNGGITVSTNWASNGSQSMRSYQPNTGSPSHLHATRPTTINESDVRVTFDVYITGKENTGSADAFEVGGRPKSANQGGIHYRVNFVSSGSSIAALNGTSWETMESFSTNTKYHVVINANYSTDTYTVELNGVSHGPFNFYNESQPSEANYIHHRNDNYNGYLDNFTVEQSP